MCLIGTRVPPPAYQISSFYHQPFRNLWFDRPLEIFGLIRGAPCLIWDLPPSHHIWTSYFQPVWNLLTSSPSWCWLEWPGAVPPTHESAFQSGRIHQLHDDPTPSSRISYIMAHRQYDVICILSIFKMSCLIHLTFIQLLARQEGVLVHNSLLSSRLDNRLYRASSLLLWIMGKLLAIPQFVATW